jgi:hypothetical protein
MADEFVGSHEKSKAGYGTNGDPNPSSVPTNKQPPLANPKVAGPDAKLTVPNLSDDSARLATIKSGGEVAHPGQAGRVHNSGSPSGNAGPVTRPVKK